MSTAEKSAGVAVVQGTAEPAAEAKSEKLGKGGIFAYGLGNIAASAEYTLKTSYHMPFMTEFAGISPALAGTMSMVMTLWDAVNDPVIGGIADRTNTKFGKYRPHMLWGILLWTAVTIMMFSVPNFSQTGLNIYYFVMLFLWSIACTGFMVPWQSLNSVLTTDVGERNWLLTSRMFIGTLSGTAMSMLLIPGVNAFGGGAKGYQLFAACVAIVSLLTALICIRGAKKRDFKGSIATPPKVGFFSQAKMFAKNKPVICIALMLGFLWLYSGINAGISIYYHTYVTGKPYLIATTALVGMVAGIIIIPIMPAVFKLMGRHRAFVIGAVLLLSTPVSLLFLRERATDTVILVTTFLSTIGFSTLNIVTVSFVPDCTDYTELHHGSPNAGLINALVSFVKKFVMSFSTMIIGLGLSMAGYVGGMSTTPALMNVILDMMIYIPIILIVLCVITLWAFPITAKYGAEMRKQLAQVREQRAMEQ